jgi:hypothetical protein
MEFGFLAQFLDAIIKPSPGRTLATLFKTKAATASSTFVMASLDD